jgi:chemotaxis protein methyltransferase CheR
VTEVLEPDPRWLSFRHTLERETGVPLGAYKEPQLKRRLMTLMHRRNLADWPAFAKAIGRDRGLFQEVRDTLTINVSEFFRQPDRFLELQTVHLPRMLAVRRTPLRIWSAGCSIGCEPYTLSIILNELDPGGRHQVIATDVDLPILERARRGDGYISTDVRAVPSHLLSRYFIFDGTTYRVTEEVRRRVSFRRQDLLSDAFPAELDLILCRNVVIYFNETAKKRIFSGFAKALRPGGLLFVGGSEMIIGSQSLGLHAAGTSIYERAA